MTTRDDDELPPLGDPDPDADGDFAEEHAEPTLADEPPPDDPDESVPEGRGGMDP